MTTPNNRGKTPTIIPKRGAPPALIPKPAQRRAGIAAASGVDIEDLIVQFQSLGLRRDDAVRLLGAAQHALWKVLESLDSHALAAAPITEQVSILLPRFDVGRLAQACHLAKADVQSALALLVLSFVSEARHARH